MKWYYAESVDSECWAYGGESRDEAIEAALKCERNPDGGLPFIQLSSFALAHENFDQLSDEAFWKVVVAALRSGFATEDADEQLAEDSWINAEEGFLTDAEDSIEAVLLAVLPLVLERPDWRCIESPQEVTPAGRALDATTEPAS